VSNNSEQRKPISWWVWPFIIVPVLLQAPLSHKAVFLTAGAVVFALLDHYLVAGLLVAAALLVALLAVRRQRAKRA
jgi:hypothetical protein